MPYSWDSGADFTTAAGSGFSFHDARRSYDDVAVAAKASSAMYTYREPFLSTDAAYPLLIGIDTTGSMAEWPKVFFEKLPLLYLEAVKYFPGCEISFQAINDFPADGADVALQPCPFGKGPQLDELIGKLYPVGGGGGQVKESYEIFAAYNSFLKAPKALIKPVAIILGDEAPWEVVPKEVAAFYKLTRGEDLPARVAFQKLHDVCDVFLVRKPYEGEDATIVKAWQDRGLMSKERIMTIEDPRRVVDVILGILGILTGKVELFESELKSRQDPSQVSQVLNSLHALKHSIHTVVDPSQRSVSMGAKGARGKTRGLKID